jgi:phosphoribosyl 1,2-cyclic phosphodiesterase
MTRQNLPAIAGKTVVIADLSVTARRLEAAAGPRRRGIATHTPAHADLVIVGHSHHDHLLDAEPSEEASSHEACARGTPRRALRARIPPDPSRRHSSTA